MNSNFSGRLNADAPQAGQLEAEFHQALCSYQFSAPRRARRLPQWLKYLGQCLIDFGVGSQTLSIRQKICPNGTTQWIVYNAASDTRHVFPSEGAVRAWVEQRYYQ